MKFFGWRVYTVLRNQGKTLPARGPLDCSLQEKGAPLEKKHKIYFSGVHSGLEKLASNPTNVSHVWSPLFFEAGIQATMSISMFMNCTEMEFLDINSTKD
jgi:hypothetical protein